MFQRGAEQVTGRLRVDMPTGIVRSLVVPRLLVLMDDERGYRSNYEAAPCDSDWGHGCWLQLHCWTDVVRVRMRTYGNAFGLLALLTVIVHHMILVAPFASIAAPEPVSEQHRHAVAARRGDAAAELWRHP
jgi:hypothetical protein